MSAAKTENGKYAILTREIHIVFALLPNRRLRVAEDGMTPMRGLEQP